MIERLKELMVKATARPWHVYREYNIAMESGRSIAGCGGYADNRNTEKTHWENVANAQLIAEAINALPSLIERLETAEARVKELESPLLIQNLHHQISTWERTCQTMSDNMQKQQRQLEIVTNGRDLFAERVAELEQGIHAIIARGSELV
jgi:hypothetical protein